MKKIDLHIHTAKTDKDDEFNFDLNSLKNYIEEKGIDIIAITNHNYFDKSQFITIQSTLNIMVYPGMELDIEKSHLLIIGDTDKIDELETVSNQLSLIINDEKQFITFDEFSNIFKNYKDYLLIPHYFKKPKMQESTIKNFNGEIKCGEVSNSKKFLQVIKDTKKLVPLVFSDFRPGKDLLMPNKYTYVDINSCDFDVLRNAIEDRNKVFVTKKKSIEEIEYLADGSTISTKLNVIIGTRTSGKTYNIEKIKDVFNKDDCLYIKQFSLIGASEDEKFDQIIQKECHEKTENFCDKLKPIVENILSFDINEWNSTIDKQIDEFKEYANVYNIDEFSKTIIFSEQEYYIDDNGSANKLIDSLRLIYTNEWNKEIVEKYINKNNIKELLEILINLRIRELEEIMFKKKTNGLIKELKEILSVKSSANAPTSLDLNQFFKNRMMIKIYDDFFVKLKKERLIDSQKLPLFDVIIKTKCFDNVSDIKKILKNRFPLKEIFDLYKNNNLYKYIWQLNELGISKDDISKVILNIQYDVKNEIGESPSGGEKAEFNLLKEIKDATRYDILLIDEPEASFDNPFISNNIIDLIKQISKNTTVCVTTHNSTLAMMLNPNKIIFTENKNGIHNVYYGSMGDKVFKSSSGDTIISYDKVLEVLEAGEKTYIEKGRKYESFKNRK